MSSQIIGFADWLSSPPGRYLLDWEQRHFDDAVGDVFGFHALQLGLPQVHALRCNRIAHQWLALGPAEQALWQAPAAEPPQRPLPAQTAAPDSASASALRSNAAELPRAALLLHPAALPFPEASLDLVVLPHTLELSEDPHTTLREVERVLVPEGRLVISGLNPASLWGFRQQRGHWCRRLGFGELFLPEDGEFIGYWRLRDWLRLLSFEVESAHFGCYRPALSHARWLERFAWMDQAGPRWWPIFGAAYFLVAVKRVRGMRLLEPAWKARPKRASAPAVLTRRG